MALSGVVFAVLFLVGWFASGGDAPDYGATDEDWTLPFTTRPAVIEAEAA